MTLGIVLFTLSGLVFGSFGNVLLYRVHANKPITGRSACPSCHRILRWFELFPVLSFIVLRGKCGRCHHKISVQYPLVELGSALLFLFAFLLHSSDPAAALVTAFILYFLFLACVFDALYQQIPDVFTILIALLALVSVILSDNIVSAGLGAALMLAWFGGQWVISRGRAVGTGDIFLTAALGVWLGLLDTVMMIVFSYMAGAIVIVGLMLLKRIGKKQQKIAFVPFLGMGVLITLLGLGDVYLRAVGF